MAQETLSPKPEEQGEGGDPVTKAFRSVLNLNRNS